ncbi:hypothetical protein P9112_010999 [Eukaryota sp. TZLM1-RC]
MKKFNSLIQLLIQLFNFILVSHNKTSRLEAHLDFDHSPFFDLVHHMTTLDECNICRNDIFSNPTITFQVAVCGHRYCRTCVSEMFQGTRLYPCPICRRGLRPTDFQTEERDRSLTNEISYRKEMSKIFCKRLEDFATEDEYFEFLELFEQLVYNKVHNIDIEKTNNIIEDYKNKNKTFISEIRARQSKYKEDIKSKNEEFVKAITTSLTKPQIKKQQATVPTSIPIRQEQQPHVEPPVKRPAIEEERTTKHGEAEPFALPEPSGGSGFLSPRKPEEVRQGAAAPLGHSLPSYVPSMPRQFATGFDVETNVVKIGPAAYESTWEKELVKREAGGWTEELVIERCLCTLADLFVSPQNA